MSDQLTFDAEQARAIETLYMSESVLARRKRAFELLGLGKGDRFLDLGCGPGFLATEAAQIVGAAGQVHALDSSDSMLSLARARAEKDAEAEYISFHQGDATALPFPDDHFDAVAVLQVYEYVADIDSALAELRRTLKPDGRYVIIDTDWQSMVYHSLDPDLTSRILDAFDGHLADPNLPRGLGPKLRATPLAVTKVEPFVQLSAGNADAYTKALTKIASDYVRNRAGLTDAEVDEWLQGLDELETADATFMSLTQFFFAGSKLQ